MKMNRPLPAYRAAQLRHIAGPLLMVVALCLTMLPTAAMAQEPVDAPPFDYVPRSIPLVGPDDFEFVSEHVADGEGATATATDEIDLSTATRKIYLPVLSNNHSFFRSDRIGFGSDPRYSITSYPDIRSLNAGWYVDWSVRINPERPAGMEYVQMIRVHQVIDSTKMYNATTPCGISVTADRTICPYVDPPQYEYWPPQGRIEQAARTNPGSIWLIGNEMDRPDWRGGRMDEMMPGLYAVAYHDLRAIIKKADPKARIAIGGVTLPTPLRLQYLDKVWAEYKKWYGTDMPVDIWNVHNFIGSETCRIEKVGGRNEYSCYSFAVPPGANTNAAPPSYIGRDNLHIDMATFKKQIRDFRAWMKSKGQEKKPLIVSEYGVLYPTLCVDTDPAKKQACVNAWNKAPGGYINLEDPAVVHKFMLDTFHFFATEKDCTLSGVDECRLVQRWAWFSLQDVGWNFNPHGSLFDVNSRAITAAGTKFRTFARTNWQALRYQ
jgi:hypothetical protein